MLCETLFEITYRYETQNLDLSMQISFLPIVFLNLNSKIKLVPASFVEHVNEKGCKNLIKKLTMFSLLSEVHIKNK